MARLRGQKSGDKEFWMPDEQCKECYKCRKPFTMFRRRHHCRICGQIFCAKCASHSISGKAYNQKGQLRICNFCYTEHLTSHPNDQAFLPGTSALSMPGWHPHDDNDADSTRTQRKQDRNSFDASLQQSDEPVIPSQDPPAAAPMMQIPTTAVKKPNSETYGNENLTAVALEISSDQDNVPFLSSSTQEEGDSDSGPPGVGEIDSGGLKRLFDAGTSLLRSRSRSNTTNSYLFDEHQAPASYPANANPTYISQQQKQPSASSPLMQHQSLPRIDHGGGTIVTENDLSPFFINALDDTDDRASPSPSEDTSTIGMSRSIPTITGFRSPPFLANKTYWDHAPSSSSTTGSDSETYDLHLRAKRTEELRGHTSPNLRKRSNTSLLRPSSSTSSRRRFRSIHISTSNLPRSESSQDNWSPNVSVSPYLGHLPAIHTSQSTSSLPNSTSPLLSSKPLPPNPSSSSQAALLVPLLQTSSSTTSLSRPTSPTQHNIDDDDDPSHGSTSSLSSSALFMDKQPPTNQMLRSPPRSTSRRLSAPLPNVELSINAINHAKKLLRQLMIKTSFASLPVQQQDAWQAVIMNLLLQMTDCIQPDVCAGDDMDVRHYIKIKKIPGGKPTDSFYVKGVVCSKHVAHKLMDHPIVRPRILILLFSLDYSRVEMENQLLSIRPVLSQEREHVSKLVARIIALRPSLVLVRSTVSRIALEILLKAGITVVHNVKYSVLEAVARCTQASVITSVDKLQQGDISFGECGYFETRTYLHEWIPNRRKSFLFFDDCPPQLGGTLILRGGTFQELQVAKRLLDFMVFVVNNLKLESSFLRDSFAKNRGIEQSQIKLVDPTPPPTGTSTPLSVSTQDVKEHHDRQLSLGSTPLDVSAVDNGSSCNPSISSPSSPLSPTYAGALDSFLHVYQDTILSASQFVVFPPPYLLTSLKATDVELTKLEHTKPTDTPTTATTPATPNSAAMLATSGLAIVSSNSSSPAPLPHPPRINFDATLPPSTLTVDKALQPRYELLVAKKHQLARAWEAYVRESPDFISPYYHQNIVVLYSNVCTVTTMPCSGPQIRVFEYYREDSDVPLGQYLMGLFADAQQVCSSQMCDYLTKDHYLSYAHGDARVNVITQSFPCPVKGMTDKLLMWSFCKECQTATQVATVSENTWNYSFGKFLEIFFYQQGVYCRADICPHEMGRHHVRFFGYMDMAVSFQYETIGLLEVVTPPTRLFVLSQVQMERKEFERNDLWSKINKFYQSILDRNKSFPFDLVDPQLLDECKAALQELSDRSVSTRKKMLQMLQNIFATTAKNDTLTINWVRRILYQEVSDWDLEYVDLVRLYLMPERELRKLTTSQLRKMFTDPAASTNLVTTPGLSSSGPVRSPTSYTHVQHLFPSQPQADDDCYFSWPISTSSTAHDHDLEDDCRLDLPILGMRLAEGHHTMPTFDKIQIINTGKAQSLMIPSLSSSPSQIDPVQMDSYSDADELDAEGVAWQPKEKDGLHGNRFPLKPSVRRRLSLELEREMQLRFQTTGTSTGPSAAQSGISPMTSTAQPIAMPLPKSLLPGSTNQASPPAATPDSTGAPGSSPSSRLSKSPLGTMTPSRIPIPNINLSNTLRPQLSPPLYDTLLSGHGKHQQRWLPPNKIPMTPLRVPLAFELNVSTPKLRMHPHQDASTSHHTTVEIPKRVASIYDPLPPLPLQQHPPYHSNMLPSENLQHIPSMFRSQYANNDSGHRALESIRRRTLLASNHFNHHPLGLSGSPTMSFSSLGAGTHPSMASHRYANSASPLGSSFRSRLPRKKETVIQVYTQPKELVTEDMDDEFLVSDLDDIGELDSEPDSPHQLDRRITRHSSSASGSRGLHHPSSSVPPAPVNEEPIDYFSPNAPFACTSPSSTSDLYSSKAASFLSPVVLTPDVPPTSLLQRLDSGSISATHQLNSPPVLPKDRHGANLTDSDTNNKTTISMDPSASSTTTSTADTQLPLASELLSSPLTAQEDVDAKLSNLATDASTTKQLPSSSADDVSTIAASTSTADNALPDRSSSRMANLRESRRSIIDNEEKSSFMKTITGFLTDHGTSNLLPLETPLNATEHVLPDSFVVVREDEPSSIIAYALSCDDYLKKMKDMSDQGSTLSDAQSMSDTSLSTVRVPPSAAPVEDVALHANVSTASMPLLQDPPTASAHLLESSPNKVQETLLKDSGSHLRYNFSDATTKFFCKTFYAEQFDALRRQSGCDDSFVLSLANCVKWDPVGGKSGSAFLKTKDDRFLMKQMSRFELDAFLDFAPAYFQYLSKAFFMELPTVLAKIFGFYSIGYKNSSTGNSMRMDVLVMENLFYQRNIKMLFDLKGSMRNRHVESTGKQDEVLLDENLVELIFQSPLFIRSHAKDLLRSSLHNDTLFLSNHNVMDYSLLVGIDEEREELVVGIVDFIRTFTWDKKLESWVKDSVFLGGGGKEPTIVSPRQYRLRFKAAMERYFLMVPDVWALAKQSKLTTSSSIYHHHS
ncbi:hypothetical protein DM01DRAFT_1308441 [Hesseltinella vesiculosa]|uniref:1-phosphatidylinositol-3-phosphate 5-kinase n=1 Tax=Hesseltinella vesiculosa TaxID=101127 RepID=A0A1X2GBS2_9FUNG|nr:hypothetical protein DM01DRAFT_1308441 [Hesseltinella vesiculosa]